MEAQCIVCGHLQMLKEPRVDGIRCKKCGGTIKVLGSKKRPVSMVDEEKPKSKLSVTVELKDLEQFQRLLAVLGEFILDERIPKEVRREYVDKIMTGTRTIEKG